ncbi:hypothetical protein ABW21_db0209608 [Orbilia brochopaga]|nr:hypothetical protein ABW21_db0209608 [Drechslerella brochopaga]
MGLIGKIIHLSVDAVIVSAFLAGVKRSTGLSYVFSRPSHVHLRRGPRGSNSLDASEPNITNGRRFRSFKTEKIESKDFRGMVNRYLDFGEWVMDQSIAVMGTSAYFERKSA